MGNIKDWKTTIPTVCGIIASALGLFKVIDMDAVPQANELLTTAGFSILSFVGLFSRWDKK